MVGRCWCKWACGVLGILVVMGCGEPGGDELAMESTDGGYDGACHEKDSRTAMATGQGTMRLEARWPSELEVSLALVEEAGHPIYETVVTGGDIEMVVVEAGRYMVEIGDEYIDEWGNRWVFDGLDQVLEVGEAGCEKAVIAAQAPTLVTDGGDDGAYGSLRSVVQRVAPGSEIEIDGGVEEIILQEPLEVRDDLRLVGQGYRAHVVGMSAEFRPPGGALMEVGGGGETSQLWIEGVSLRGSPGAGETGLRIDGGEEEMDIQIVDSQWSDFDGAIVVTGGEGLVISLKSSSFVDNHGVHGGALRIRGEGASAMETRGEELIFSDNHSTGHGGAVHVEGAVALSMKGIVWEQNWAGGKGGALFVDEGEDKVSIRDSVGHSNDADGSGGALYISRSAEIDRGHFASNSAAELGGAVVVADGEGHLRRTVFESNQAEKGGALALRAVGVAPEVLSHAVWGYGLDQVLFESNQATLKGGGVYVQGSGDWVRGYVDVDNTTFSANEAGAAGGAIFWGPAAVGTINFSSFVANACWECAGGAAGIEVGPSASRVHLRANLLAERGVGSAPLLKSRGGALRSGGFNYFGDLSADVGGGFDLHGSDEVDDRVRVKAISGEGYERGHAWKEQSLGARSMDWEECQRHRLDRFNQAHATWNPVSQNDRGRPVGNRCSPGAFESGGYSQLFIGPGIGEEPGSGQFGVGGDVGWQYEEAYASKKGSMAGGMGLVLEGANSWVGVDDLGSHLLDGQVGSMAILFRTHGDRAQDDRQLRVRAGGEIIAASRVINDGQELWLVDGLARLNIPVGGEVDVIIEPVGEGEVLIDHVSWY